MRIFHAGLASIVLAGAVAGALADDRASVELADEAASVATLEPTMGVARAVTCADGNFKVTPGKSLVVRSLAVVNHADAEGLGAWSFGGLMKSLTPAGYPGGAAGFTRDWLAGWETNVTVNGVETPRVTNMRDKVIDPWPRKGGGLDLAQSPFRLLAIVNRIDRYDLAEGRAGELRFVFSAVESNPRFPNRKLPLNFTVIFELAVPGTTLADARAWARAWAELSEHDVESATYHTKLRAITDPLLANARGNLRAVRTNEVSIDDPWDLRHFTLAPGATGRLRLTALAMTPMIRANRSAALSNWMFESPARRQEILLGKHRLPAAFGGRRLRGNYAPMTMVAEGNDSFRWETDGSRPNTDANNDVRHALSLFSCNGCHSGETGTNAMHIVPRKKNEVAGLSRFMTGKSMPDIVRPSQVRTFNDLARRERAIEKLLCGQDAADADRSFDE